MFDNLREDAASSPMYEEAKFQPAAGTVPAGQSVKPRRILGMTGPQRFVIVFMLMIAVCIIGIMALLVLGKIVF